MVTTNHWPVKLFWFSYDAPTIFFSLGSVSSSFLLEKRRRQPRTGCYVAVDNEPREGKPDRKEKNQTAKGNLGVVPNILQACKKEARNGRVARLAVRLLMTDQGMKRGSAPLPSRIACGSLLSTLRTIFPDLTPVQELSLKTSKKLERPCKTCFTEEDRERVVEDYKRERFRPTGELDVDHLARFKKACAQQVRAGWNRGHYPYIPTGNATESYSRREGGSWMREEFSNTCRVEPILSSGKPRVVTLYSSFNSGVLSPLHDALYRSFQREGWLLVGSPTDEKVLRLNGDGPYVSVDYKNATDNIRAEYCRTMIEVLKEKALALSADEVRCLDVLGELRFEKNGPASLRGQPMGSLMSFPLLCLINKVCVDLALADLATTGKITWEQFRVHRCLINGDDLLYREFEDSRDILAGILRHGSLCGLVVNEEKTMVSTTDAEINSTLFVRGRKQKKTNVSAIMVRSEVSDPICFLADSVCKPKSLRLCLKQWAKTLPAMPVPQGPVPPSFLREVWRARRELTFRSVLSDQTPNGFPVVVKPADYDLTRQEEVCYISQRVARLKEMAASSTTTCGTTSFPLAKTGVAKRQKFSEECIPINAALRKRKTIREDTVLSVLADGWREKLRKSLLAEERDDAYRVPDPVVGFSRRVMCDGSLAPIGFHLVDFIKSCKGQKEGSARLRTQVLNGPGAGHSAGSRVDDVSWISLV